MKNKLHKCLKGWRDTKDIVRCLREGKLCSSNEKSWLKKIIMNFNRKEKEMLKHKYVVEKILLKHQAAEADDLIRIEKVDKRNRKVILQPLLRNRYVVSLKDFKKDYKIV